MEAIDTLWRKSSYSGNGGNCVEVADPGSRVLVRDTKQAGQGPVLAVSPDAWRRLVEQVKANAGLAPDSRP
jgi:Domain of unknown function (DUF397)